MCVKHYPVETLLPAGRVIPRPVPVVLLALAASGLARTSADETGQ
jgi:hypothetical protein